MNMKSVLLGAVAAISIGAFVGNAQAADLMDMPVSSHWTGFYVGGQAGYYEANYDYDNADFFGPSGSFRLGDGVALGAYAGYNYQLSPNFVVGIEGDYNWSLGDGKTAPFGLDSFGSIRGRLGYATDSTLLFVTGGLAFADLGEDCSGWVQGDCQVAGIGSELGYAVGGGVEHFLTDAISLKLEYVYMGGFEYGVNQFSVEERDIARFSVPSGELDIHTVRFGVGFHF